MKDAPTILVTGGTGYIGSHTVVELLNAGFKVIILDDLSNSKIEVIDKIEQITGKRPKFVKGDCCDPTLVNEVFKSKIDGVIHFAAYKSVGESVERPMQYYYNNVVSMAFVLWFMACKTKNIIFSSSCTVYFITYSWHGINKCIQLSNCIAKPINI